jgi:hypothetical protein
MLQLQRYSPPQALKANHSQRVGNTEAQLEQLCEKILKEHQDWSYYCELWCYTDSVRGAARRYENNMDDCENALKPLLIQLENLECDGKDERVATLRSTLQSLKHYNDKLGV